MPLKPVEINRSIWKQPVNKNYSHRFIQLPSQTALEHNPSQLAKDSIGLTRYGQSPINRYISNNLKYAQKHYQSTIQTDRVREHNNSMTKPTSSTQLP